MNKVFWVALAAVLASCSTREIQAEFVNAELIRVDTVYRHPKQEAVLTWRCKDKVQFVTFARLNHSYTVGTIFPVLLTK